MKQQIKILTCGSVDDGKSTLIGHMIYDSKLLYTDQAKSLEMDSKIRNNDGVDYSLLLDGLDEEREQKITIDIAYRYFNTNKRNFIILDSPGHEEYTRNMAVGASKADLAILLIDASKGTMIQTKRHIKICLLMGIKHFIVAINKMDLINYDKNIFNKIENEIKPMFENKDINTLEFIPLSATIGDNINSKSKNMSWYKGKPLLKYLETVKIVNEENNSFIMPVQRVCRPNQNFRGFQGTIQSGKIAINEELTCLPSNEKANIKELYSLDKKVEQISCGQAVTITLDKEIDISRGCVLTNDKDIVVTNKLNVTMLWMDDTELKLNTAYYLNIGTMSTLCYIKKINNKIDINNDSLIKTETITKNEIISCELELLERIPVTSFSHNKSLGSLILINRITNNTSACAVINEFEDNNQNLFFYETTINKLQRSENLKQKPITIWFTGLSCSGKSTIANELEKILISQGYHTMLLDGDNIRLGINNDLKFSEEDRIENIRRVANIAKLFNDSGLICITSFISPLEINRKMARDIIRDDFFLVYVNTSIEECEKRDKKGLYEKARKNIIKDFTGVNSPYEEPIDADIVIYNDDATKCAITIFNKIKNKIEYKQ